MATLQEIQARNQALKQAQAAGAIPGKATAQTSAGKELAKAVPAAPVATGMQGSNESIHLIGNQEIQVFDDPDPKSAEAAVAVYQDLTLRKFVRKGGSWHKAVNGFFYAQDERDVKELEHFAKHGKVKKYQAKQEPK